MTFIEQTITLTSDSNGQRLDAVAASAWPDYSRSRLQEWIKSGELTVNGQPSKPKQKVFSGDVLVLAATLQDSERWLPEPIEFDVIFEDDDIIVINKPDGLVVHPGAGVGSGTLLNGLLHRFPELGELPRAGIVHRLDKHTTGIMVIARTLRAQTSLVDQLQSRTMGGEYQAVVVGEVPVSGEVDAPIGRHPQARVKMAVVDSGKPAKTLFFRERIYSGYSHIRCRLATGRTHQIRVHMAHIGHPLVGDDVYNPRNKLAAGTAQSLAVAIQSFPRQALHAQTLSLVHPANGEQQQFSVPLPDDFEALLEALRDG